MSLHVTLRLANDKNKIWFIDPYCFDNPLLDTPLLGE